MCWTSGYDLSQDLRIELLEFLRAEGWQVQARDDLHFDASPRSDETAADPVFTKVDFGTIHPGG